MSIDDVITRLRGQLEEAFGVESASYLMDRPPGGWHELVTNERLSAELSGLRREMALEFAAVRPEMVTMRAELALEIERAFSVQTWRLVTAMLSSMAVLVAVMVAAVRL